MALFFRLLEWLEVISLSNWHLIYMPYSHSVLSQASKITTIKSYWEENGIEKQKILLYWTCDSLLGTHIEILKNQYLSTHMCL